MKPVRYGLVAATAIALSSGVAPMAHSQVEFSGNVAIVSDYIFRGITQTSENAAIQGGVDASLPGGIYLGTWASSVHFADNDQAAAEIDVYGGIAPSVSGVDLDLGVIYYGYPGADSDLNYDFVELYGGASRAFGPVTGGLSGAYSPEFFGETGAAFFGQASASAGIPDTPVSLDASLGKQWLDEVDSPLPSYLVWTAGAAVDLMGIVVGAGVSGTDIEEADPQVFFSISRGM